MTLKSGDVVFIKDVDFYDKLHKTDHYPIEFPKPGDFFINPNELEKEDIFSEPSLFLANQHSIHDLLGLLGVVLFVGKHPIFRITLYFVEVELGEYTYHVIGSESCFDLDLKYEENFRKRHLGKYDAKTAYKAPKKFRKILYDPNPYLFQNDYLKAVLTVQYLPKEFSISGEDLYIKSLVDFTKQDIPENAEILKYNELQLKFPNQFQIQ